MSINKTPSKTGSNGLNAIKEIDSQAEIRSEEELNNTNPQEGTDADKNEEEQNKENEKRKDEQPGEKKKPNKRNDNSRPSEFYSKLLGPTLDEPILAALKMLFNFCSFKCKCEKGKEEQENDDCDRTEEKRSCDCSKAIELAQCDSDSIKPCQLSHNCQSYEYWNYCPSCLKIKTNRTCGACQTCELHTESIQVCCPKKEAKTTTDLLSTQEQVSQAFPDSSSLFSQTDSNQTTQICQCSLNTETDVRQSSQKVANSYKGFLKQLFGCCTDYKTAKETLLQLGFPTDVALKILETSFPKMEKNGSYEIQCISSPDPPNKLCRCCKQSPKSLSAKSSQCPSKKALTTKYSCGINTKSCLSIYRNMSPQPSKMVDKCCQGDAGRERSCKCEMCPEEVRFAVTKITRFRNFTTYEVMKSTRHQPRKLPPKTEGVFVVRRKKL